MDKVLLVICTSRGNLASQRVLLKSDMSYSHTICEEDGLQTLVYDWHSTVRKDGL